MTCKVCARPLIAGGLWYAVYTDRVCRRCQAWFCHISQLPLPLEPQTAISTPVFVYQ